MSDKQLTFTLPPEHVAVIVHFEGTAYFFDKDGAPLVATTNQRTRVIIRALLDAAIGDLDAQVEDR